MKKTLSFLLIICSIAIFGTRISKNITFKQNVKGYLKRAADANTVELANAELTRVIDYLEANNLTSGYTSVMWETPDEDIDFWYRNLKASQNELQNLGTASALEKTNVLIKLRETLLDVGERTKVTVPEGLHVYPNNKLWAGLTTFAFSAISVGLILLIPAEEKKIIAPIADNS